ncbi:MAG TPA: HEAT repeat domain-containing protein [Myxococcales bacterium]|jgi:HEAT repeat protein
MRPTSRLVTCLALAAALASSSACSSDPNSIKDQAKILKDPDAEAKQKLRAVENLKKIGKAECVPALVAGLKKNSPKVRAEIAAALVEFKEPTTIPAIADAFELEPAKKSQADVDGANQKIAQALGEMGGKSAVPALLKLFAATQSNYVKFDVLNALGKIGGSEAVPMLTALALDEKAEAPFNKKAFTALSLIAPKEAMPLFLKGLFHQRGQLSMYPDAAFGLFRLRPASHDAVLALMNGKDAETLAFAKEKKYAPAIVASIAAQVAGHLRDPRMIRPLLKQLKTKDADPDLALVAQTAAVEALGRIKSRAAVGPLCELLKGEDRVKVADALGRIGDKSALPKLVACAGQGNWISREPCIQGIVALGGKNEVRQFESFIQAEPKKFLAECKAGDYGEVDCDKERVRVTEERTKNLTSYRKALETVSGCADTKCYADALASDDPVVREKAAYAVAEKGDLEALDALLASINRPVKAEADLVPRLAAVLAVDWMVGTKPDARAKIKGGVPLLQATIERDAKIAQNAESTEEIQRLVDVIQNGRELAPAPVGADEAAVAEEQGEQKPPEPKPAPKPVAKKKAGKKKK